MAKVQKYNLQFTTRGVKTMILFLFDNGVTGKACVDIYIELCLKYDKSTIVSLQLEELRQ